MVRANNQMSSTSLAVVQSQFSNLGATESDVFSIAATGSPAMSVSQSNSRSREDMTRIYQDYEYVSATPSMEQTEYLSVVGTQGSMFTNVGAVSSEVVVAEGRGRGRGEEPQEAGKTELEAEVRVYACAQ